MHSVPLVVQKNGAGRTMYDIGYGYDVTRQQYRGLFHWSSASLFRQISHARATICICRDCTSSTLWLQQNCWRVDPHGLTTCGWEKCLLRECLPLLEIKASPYLYAKMFRHITVQSARYYRWWFRASPCSRHKHWGGIRKRNSQWNVAVALHQETSLAKTTDKCCSLHLNRFLCNGKLRSSVVSGQMTDDWQTLKHILKASGMISWGFWAGKKPDAQSITV